MDESKTILHLLVGKICSGKSTLAASQGRSTRLLLLPRMSGFQNYSVMICAVLAIIFDIQPNFAR
jgi:hypothetical protein